MKKLKCPSCTNSKTILDSTWLKAKGFSNLKNDDVICGLCGKRFKDTRKEKVVFT